MKKIIFLGFLGLLLSGCQVEEAPELPENNVVTTNATVELIELCHWDKTTQTFEVIAIPQRAIQPHLNHGDALLDADGDGYTAVGSCTGSANDCDDDDPQVYPGANEICGDGIDNNCDGEVDENCGVPNELFAEYVGNGGPAYNDFYPSGRTGLIILQEDTTFDVIWFEEFSYVDYACIEYHSTIEEYDSDNQTGVFRFRLVPTEDFCGNDKFTDEFIDFAFNGSTLELRSFDTGAVIGTLIRQ